MDHTAFDALTRRLVSDAANRRLMVKTVAGIAAAAIVGRLGTQDAAAACKDIGKKCKQAADCCSRRCKGKRGKKKCKVGADACPVSTGCGGAAPVCGTEPGGDCICRPTVEGNNACIGFIEDCNEGGGFRCTSTAECVRERGPRFVCQAEVRADNGQVCGCGQVCLPTCEG